MTEIMKLQLSDVRPDPTQPRKKKPAEEITSLGRSIEREGQLTPIRVRKDPENEGKWLIVMGECRYHAHVNNDTLRANGTIEAIAEDETNDLGRIHTRQLAENFNRIQMSWLETADGFVTAVELGTTVDELSESLGIPVPRIKRDMALAGLPDEVRTAIDDGKCPIAVGEKILALFPDNDVTQSKAWAKAKKKRGSKDMIAALEAYYGDIHQGKISALDVAKQEAPEVIKKAGKDFKKFQKAFKAFQANGYTNGKASAVLKAKKSEVNELEEIAKALIRMGDHYLNTIRLYKAQSGLLEENPAEASAA